MKKLENLKIMVRARWEFGKFGSTEESRLTIPEMKGVKHLANGKLSGNDLD